MPLENIAMDFKTPENDPGKMLDLANKAIQFRGLQQYRSALDSGASPEQAATILSRTNPELASKVLDAAQGNRTNEAKKSFSTSGNLTDLRIDPSTYTTATEGASNDFKLGAEHRARTAYAVLHEKDPTRRLQMWQTNGDDWARKGWIDPTEWSRIRNSPSNTMLEGIIRHSQGVAQSMTSSGETAGAEAGARHPYDAVVNPKPGETRIEYPGGEPGSPTYGQPQMQPGHFAPTPVAPPPVTVTPSTNAPRFWQPGEKIMDDDISPTPGPQAAAAAPGAAPAPVAAGKSDKPSAYYNEAPVAEIAPPLRAGPGVVAPGTHPAVAEANRAAQKLMTDEIQPTAVSAAKTKASLGTMRSILEKGQVPTSRLAEVKLAVGAFLNGVFNEPDAKTASKLVGMNLPSAEVLNKETTRMGLLFARQTEGAREAVMAIQIALSANPSLLNTVEGNKKIISIMEKASDYDIERGKAAEAYYKKQLDHNGSGHLQGFDSWYARAHPPAAFMSKALPYQLPKSQSELQPGVTYEWPKSDDKGKPMTDPKTKQPVMNRGVYDQEKGFIHE